MADIVFVRKRGVCFVVPVKLPELGFFRYCDRKLKIQILFRVSPADSFQAPSPGEQNTKVSDIIRRKLHQCQIFLTNIFSENPVFRERDPLCRISHRTTDVAVNARTAAG
jgi:hypothetical protein